MVMSFSSKAVQICSRLFPALIAWSAASTASLISKFRALARIGCGPDRYSEDGQDALSAAKVAISRDLDAGFDLANDPAAARSDALARHAVRRFGKPADIAAMAVWLASEKASYVTATLWDISAGR